VILLDNNFLASSKWKEKLEYFIRHNIKVCFSQGLDIRLINCENAKLLAQIRYYDNHFRRRRLYFAFDDPSLEYIVKEKVSLLMEHGIPSNHLLFYMLVGYNTTFDQDMRRFEVLKELRVLPFVMIYNDRRDRKQIRDFARWVNKRYYNVCPFSEYNCVKR